MHIPDITSTFSTLTSPLESEMSSPAAKSELSHSNQDGNPMAFWNSAAHPSTPDLGQVYRLAHNSEVVRLAEGFGLSVVDVAWEDTSRWQHSAYGANITDATLRVRGQQARCSIIRNPNFEDQTCDFNIGHFKVKTGNEKGARLETKPLQTYLNQLFSASCGVRDAIGANKEILVAPQTCVLPLQDGTCTFNMELFNYQANEDYPAILAVVCTDEGTSAQVATQSGPQKLFFNRNGRACDFFAERLKHVREREGRALDGAMNAQEEERNILLLFQVPLRVPSRRYVPDYDLFGAPGFSVSKASLYPGFSAASGGYGSAMAPSYGAAALPPAPGAAYPQAGTTMRSAHTSPSYLQARQAQGVDHAQLGTTTGHGPFPLLPPKFELDTHAAIRCTVQHYLVTDTGTLSIDDMRSVRQKMDAILSRATASGSLVVDTDAAERSTAPQYA